MMLSFVIGFAVAAIGFTAIVWIAGAVQDAAPALAGPILTATLLAA